MPTYCLKLRGRQSVRRHLDPPPSPPPIWHIFLWTCWLNWYLLQLILYTGVGSTYSRGGVQVGGHCCQNREIRGWYLLKPMLYRSGVQGRVAIHCCRALAVGDWYLLELILYKDEGQRWVKRMHTVARPCTGTVPEAMSNRLKYVWLSI